MDPIFARDAQVVGWFKNETFYDANGHPLGFLRNTNMYSYDGSHRGTLKHGFLRDTNGNVVAFMKGATGGPITQSPRVVPAAPAPRPRPTLPAIRITPKEGLVTKEWSDTDFVTLLRPEERERRAPRETMDDEAPPGLG